MTRHRRARAQVGSGLGLKRPERRRRRWRLIVCRWINEESCPLGMHRSISPPPSKPGHPRKLGSSVVHRCLQYGDADGALQAAQSAGRWRRSTSGARPDTQQDVPALVTASDQPAEVTPGQLRDDLPRRWKLCARGRSRIGRNDAPQTGFAFRRRGCACAGRVASRSPTRGACWTAARRAPAAIRQDERQIGLVELPCSE